MNKQVSTNNTFNSNYIKEVTHIMNALNVDNVTEEQIASSLEENYVEKAHNISMQKASNIPGSDDDSESDDENSDNQDKNKKNDVSSKASGLSPDQLILLRKRISMYKELNSKLSVQIKEIENIIDDLKNSIKGPNKELKQQLISLQKLRGALLVTQQKLSALVELEKQHQKQIQKEQEILKRREKIKKLLKLKEKQTEKLKKQIDNAKKIDTLAQFLLPGKWMNEHSKDKVANLERASEKLANIDKKISKEMKREGASASQQKPAKSVKKSKGSGINTKHLIKKAQSTQTDISKSLNEEDVNLQGTISVQELQNTHQSKEDRLFSKLELDTSTSSAKIPQATPPEARKTAQEKKHTKESEGPMIRSLRKK